MASEPTHPYEILDVFTDTPLQGNGLAVFTQGEQIPSRLMQATARELNLSETVFLLPGDAECDAQLRIFTPTTELAFAGHPTLGAAFVVAARDGRDAVRLRTGAGIVPVRLTRDGDGAPTFGEMDQPIPSVAPYPDAVALGAALGLPGPTALPVEGYTNGPRHVIVVVPDAEGVAGLAPDLGAIARLLPDAGVSCLALLGAGVAKTRMFAPGMGVSEDPATGSAAGPIAVHLVRHGRLASGETLELRQGAEIGRPSRLFATATGARDAITAVSVGGSAVPVARGHFRLQ